MIQLRASTTRFYKVFLNHFLTREGGSEEVREREIEGGRGSEEVREREMEGGRGSEGSKERGRKRARE
jgi:hypothetical protein